MNRSRTVILMALMILLVAVVASTALAGAKTPEKGSGWDPVPVDLAPQAP